MKLHDFFQNAVKYHFLYYLKSGEVLLKKNPSETEWARTSYTKTKMSKEFCSGKYLGARTGMVFRFQRNRKEWEREIKNNSLAGRIDSGFLEQHSLRINPPGKLTAFFASLRWNYPWDCFVWVWHEEELAMTNCSGLGSPSYVAMYMRRSTGALITKKYSCYFFYVKHYT
jgi:hypothetical protein